MENRCQMEKRPKFKRKAMHSSRILNTRKTAQASNFSVIALSVAQKGSAVAGPRSSTRRGTSSTARRRSRTSRRSSRRCVSDQHSRAEPGRRNGARPRAGTQLRGGRERGAQPRATLVERGQGDQGPDRDVGQPDPRRLGARWPSGEDDERGHARRCTRDRLDRGGWDKF